MIEKKREYVWAVALVLFLAVCLRGLILVSYPPSIVGDAVDYWRIAGDMAQGRFQSSLIRSTGYPLVLSFPLMALEPIWDISADAAYRLVLSFQHVVSLAGVILLFDLVRRTVNWRVAIVAGLLSALSPIEAAMANLPRPESFLSVLIVFLFWLTVRAPTVRCSTLLYMLLGLLTGLSVLVRPNSLVLVPFVVIAILLYARSRSRRFQLAAVGTCLALTAISFWSYLAFIHQPSTGTWKYNYVLGWNLKDVVLDSGLTFDIDNGPASHELVRYHYVGGIDLPRPFVPSVVLFQHVDHAVEPEAVDRFAAAPIPPQPTTNDIDQYKLFYVLGLERADKLMTQASIETVRADPLHYLVSVLRRAARYFAPPYRPPDYFPLPPAREMTIDRYGPAGLAWADVDVSYRWRFERTSLVWLPGVEVLQAYYALYQSVWFLYPVAFIASGVLVWLRPRRHVFLTLGWSLLVVWIVSVSAVIPPNYRYVVPIEPLANVLVATVLVWTCEVSRRAIRSKIGVGLGSQT